MSINLCWYLLSRDSCCIGKHRCAELWSARNLDVMELPLGNHQGFLEQGRSKVSIIFAPGLSSEQKVVQAEVEGGNVTRQDVSSHPGPERKGKMVLGNFHTSVSTQVGVAFWADLTCGFEEPQSKSRKLKCPRTLEMSEPGLASPWLLAAVGRVGWQRTLEYCLCHQPCATRVSPPPPCVCGGARGQCRCHFAVHLFFSPFSF